MGAMMSSRLELPSASSRCSRGRMRGPEGTFLTYRARKCGLGAFCADMVMRPLNRPVWPEVWDFYARPVTDPPGPIAKVTMPREFRQAA